MRREDSITEMWCMNEMQCGLGRESDSIMAHALTKLTAVSSAAHFSSVGIAGVVMEDVPSLQRFSWARLFAFLTACISMAFANKSIGGTSVSGISVTCYRSVQDCKDGCRFSCYAVDHCNDSDQSMIACAPDLSFILIVTFAFILGVASCCCLACFCLPICCCYRWCHNKRRKRTSSNEKGTLSLIPSPPQRVS